MSKKVVRKFSAFAIILVVMLASLCVFTLYQSSVNAVILDALDDIDIDTAQISSSLDQVDVAEAAGTVSFSDFTTQYFPDGVWGNYSGSTTWRSWFAYDSVNDYGGLKHGVLQCGSRSFGTNESQSFSGSFTVTLSGKALNYARAGLLKCKISASVYWNGGGKTQYIYLSANGGTQIEGKQGSQNNATIATPYVNVGQISSGNSFSVSTGAKLSFGTAGNVAIVHGFKIELAYNGGDTTKPTINYVGNKNTNNYTVDSSSSNYFQVSDNQSALKSVTCTHTTFTSTQNSKTISYDIAKDRITSNKYSLNSFFSYDNESKYFGSYTISATDNQGNTRTFATTIYYYSATISFNAGSYGDIENISTISGKTYGDTYSISATVTADPGYYFTGWTRSGDGGTSDIGVGTYSSGKWTSTQSIVRPDANNCSGQITWTAQYATISDWFNYASGGTMTYNGSAQTNIASVSVKNDNGGTQLSYTLTYAGTSKADNTYSSASKPVFAGTYYAELTVTKGGGILGSGDSSASAFTINQATLTLTPQFTGTMSKTYNGTTAMPGVGCSTWTFDTTASPQKNDGLSASTRSDSEFSFKIPDANADTKTIQICGAGGAVLNVGSSLSAYVKLSTTLSDDAADRVASYSLVFSGTTASYTINQKTVYVNLAYSGTVSGYVLESLYNDVPGKVYDGTTEAKLNITLNGLVNNETYSVGVSGTSAESGKTVHLTYAPYAFSYPSPGEYTITVGSLTLKDGNGKASNYSLDSTSATCTGIYIVRKPVKLAIDGVTSKVYDGTNTATPTVVFAAGYEPLQKDNISIKADTATYSQAAVGTGLTVTLSGYSLGGTNKNYYYLDTETVTSSAGSITKRDLTVTFTYGGKVYDGTTAVNTNDFTFAYEGLVAYDDVTATCTAAFDDANAGSRKVTSDDIFIDGSDVGNYSLTSTSYTLNAVTISRKQISDKSIVLAAPIDSHVYDGTVYNPTPDFIDDAIGENGTTLVFGTDYDRGYSSPNIVNAGEYSFVVTGMNNYTGSKSFEFKITKADLKLTAENISLVYGQTLSASQIKGVAVNAVNESLVVDGTWSFVTEIDYNTSLASKGNIPLVSSSGTVTVLFTVVDTDTSPFNTSNYVSSDETSLELNVAPREISIVAKAQSSVYGTDPKFDKTAYSVTVALAEGEMLNFTPVTDDATLSAGTLACAVVYNSDVGNYPITSTFASENYTINYTEAFFTVTKLSVTVVPDSGQQKYFGDADPDAFTYATTTTQTLAAGFTVSLDGALARAAGETVGTYYYSLGTITDANNPNYTISLNNTRSFAVLARPIAVTASSYNVYFGEAFPDLGFTVADGLGAVIPVIGTDESGNQTITVGSQTVIFDITVIRTAKGSSVATSAITVGIYDTYAVLGTNANFTVTAERGSFEILRRPVTVTPNSGQYKTYGSSDPSSFGYTVTFTTGYEGLTGDAQVTNYSIAGVLTREAGENVGSYEIYQGTVTDDNNPNYSITFTEGVTYAVERRSVVITPVAVTIDFGDPLPDDDALTYTATGVLAGETLVGGLKFAPDVYELAAQGPVPVGNYDIVADSELNNDLNPNYDITEVRGTEALRVLALTAYIEADGNSVVFGTETYTLNFTAHDRKGNSLNNDIFSGKLALRDNPSGILTVGNYDIVLGTLECANYVVELSGNPQLSVTPKTVTVTSSDIDQIYGETRLTPEFSVTGLVDGYKLDAQSALGVSYPDREAVGKYAITLGNLENLNLNYDFVFDKEYFYYIVARHIVIVPDEGMTSVYGNTEVNITYTSYFYDEPEKAGLIGSDTLGGKLSRENSTQKGVGSYAIILGTLNNSSVAGYNANYTVELSGETVYYTITPRPVTVTANALSQVFGEAERVLTVTYSAGGLVGGDSLYGSPERESGITPGVYAITQGSLGNENGYNPNYAITFIGSSYTITERPVTFYAADASKGYGEEDPASFAYYAYGGTGTSGNAFVAGYEPTVIITRAEGEHPASYSYSYSATGDYAAYYIFTYRYDTQFTITRGQAVVNVIDAKYENGIFFIERIYRGEAYTLETELTMGTGLITTIRINNEPTDEYTDVGEYTALVSVTGDSYFAGTTATVRITVKPYDLGALAPLNILATENTSKIYGDADPSFAATVEGLNGAQVSVTFARSAGENAGSYLFDSVTVNDKNYTASVAADNYFTVEARKIEIIPETFRKTYGALDPELTQTVTSDVGESFEVTFSREDGDNAGSYDITSVTLEEGFAANYSATLGEAEDKFVIIPKAATVTANALKRVFDATDGGVTLTYTTSGFLYNDADALAGALGIADNATLPVEADTYSIVAVEEFTHPNYKITFVGAEYVIERAPVKVVSVSVSYEYGVEIEPFTYDVVEGTVYEGYPLAGELGVLTSFNVGEHPIPQGTLTDENNPNYSVTYEAGICEITVITVTVTPVKLTEQVYGDEPNFIAYTIEGNVVAEDVDENGMFIRGALACSGVSAGDHDVEIGTLREENPDYVIEFEPAGAIYRITPKAMTITAEEITVYYGNAEAALAYSVDGLVEGDSLVGALERVAGNSVGSYAINIGSLKAENANDYSVTFVSANYVIMQRPLTVIIADQSAEYSETGEYAFDGTAYKITEGTVVEGDNVGITIAKEAGNDMGLYAITGAYTNKNYEVTFVNGVYEIKKYSSFISYTASVTFIYDGTAYVIDATCSSGAPVLVTYELNGEISHVNSFSEVGKYVITLTAEETDSYYAPAVAAMEITILRDVLLAEDDGIDIRVDNEDGFAPDVSVEMEKLPQNDPGINAVISSSESVVRAYNVQVVDGNGEITTIVNNPSISVKVPSSLKENATVKVIVKEKGNYSVRILDVKEGYVTIDNASEVTTIAFISEADNDYLIYILIGGAALIILVSTIVFMFRKRA